MLKLTIAIGVGTAIVVAAAPAVREHVLPAVKTGFGKFIKIASNPSVKAAVVKGVEATAKAEGMVVGAAVAIKAFSVAKDKIQD